MDFVETEGDTIDAAIENALKLLGVGARQNHRRYYLAKDAKGYSASARRKRAFAPN